jgi:hypothetical protein
VPRSDVIFELKAEHTRRTPVFVIGYPRSGTSVTCRLLRRYLKVSYGTESQFIIRFLHRLGGYGDLQQDANVRRLLTDISAERFFARSKHNWGWEFDRERAFRSLQARTYSAVLDAIFSQLAAHNDMVRWGDKTPFYNSDLASILGLFPDAQFIHVVRDGRDVALSIPKTGFGPTNACTTAEEWAHALSQIEGFSRTLRPDQFFALRYEDLLEQAPERMAALAAFLGVDDRDGHVMAYVREHIGQEVRADNRDKWRQALPTREVERFEAVAGGTLTRFGYELAFLGRARRVSRPEQIYWQVRSRSARLLLPASWSDNRYKLALRARSALPRLGRHPRPS